MAEYGREQRDQLSRAVANSRSGNKQLKEFADNRCISHCLQRKAAMSNTKPVAYPITSVADVRGHKHGLKVADIKAQISASTSTGRKGRKHVMQIGSNWVTFTVNKEGRAFVQHYGPFSSPVTIAQMFLE